MRGSAKGSALFLATSTLALALASGSAAAEPVTLKIVHFNDLDRMEEDDGKGGVARLAAVVEEVRAGNPHVLVTHGGDSISPSLLSGFDHGAHMIDLFNQIGIDAMAVGNHEFDFGPEVAGRADRRGAVPDARPATPPARRQPDRRRRPNR